MKKLFFITLTLVLILSLCACGDAPHETSSTLSDCATTAPETTEPPMTTTVCALTTAPVETTVIIEEEKKPELSDGFKTAYLDFTAKLMREASAQAEGENSVSSPLSLLALITMLADGAEGETLRELESLLGMSIDEYYEAMTELLACLEASEASSVANSIWVNATLGDIKDAYLAKQSESFSPDVFKVPLSESTLDEVNAWVSENTDGMIDEFISELPLDTMMLLINTVLFESEWASQYDEIDVRTFEFTDGSGSTAEKKMLYSKEYRYYEGDGYTGARKTYKGGEYYFLALLPSEGTTPDEFIATLDGAALSAILSSDRYVDVNLFMPTFVAGNRYDLSDFLKANGVEYAFDEENSNFDKIWDAPNLYIDGIGQVASVTLNEGGTIAAAASGVTMAPGYSGETKDVRLDRPYVYMIVHAETCLPVFVGITNHAE